MKKMIYTATFGLMLLILAPSAYCALDDFSGDTAIYGVATSTIQPNVLIIIDTSTSMDSVIYSNQWDKDTEYPISSTACGSAACDPDMVYHLVTTTTSHTSYSCVTKNSSPGQVCPDGTVCGNKKKCDGGTTTTTTTTSYQPVIALSSVSCVNNGRNYQDKLTTLGRYTVNNSKTINPTTGACSTSNGSDTYVTGNYLDWTATGGAVSEGKKIDIARTVISDLLESTTGVNFGMMVYDPVTDDGSRFLSKSVVAGNPFTTTIKDPDEDYTTTMTNRQALINIIKDTTAVKANGWTPLGESLLEAGRYFAGQPSAYGQTIGTETIDGVTKYISPVELPCQQNYIIFITDGMSTRDDKTTAITAICPLYDCDGVNGTSDTSIPPLDTIDNSLDDIAYYLRHSTSQAIKSYYIGFGDVGGDATAVDLLNRAAKNGGAKDNGTAYFALDAGGLGGVLTQVLGNITSVDSSFIAPVVPTSPENRTYSGQRVYLGFFKPQAEVPWLGNIKKYGINELGQITDANGAIATDDSGNFVSTAVSFWGDGTTADAAIVDAGGVGNKLLTRATARNIYTNRTATADLTDSGNAFNKTNMTAANLSVVDNTARDRLVDYMYGLDSYDGNGNGNRTEKRDWILGDILHSKPQVVSYNTYGFDATTEASDTNKTVIFVGSNDGMLHAFSDKDGSELWAFVPDAIWPNLKELGVRPAKHLYYVDASPTLYVYDSDKDGNIGPYDTDSGTNDKVLLIFGLRRGGNAYYALDVTNPLVPKLAWKIDPTTTGFERMGETWSDPQYGKIKLTTGDKIVGFIGAGYDTFEDARYGEATQVPSSTPLSNLGAGVVSNTSSIRIDRIVDSAGPPIAYHWKGKGIFAFEVASLNSSGAPTFTSSGTNLWSYVPTDTTCTNNAKCDLRFSFPSDIAVVDTDRNNYVDRLYTGDTGGRMWRFDVGNTSTANWTGKIVFHTDTNNDNEPDSGRKIMYKPSLTLGAGANSYTTLLFGTGDREHPLNLALTDRFYMVKDRGQAHKTINETNLLDFTTDALQLEGATPDEVNAILSSLNADSNYGWYIDLDQRDGEKVLASPLAFNKVSYFTTFTPNESASVDPCKSGNLGASRLYAVSTKTGEAVINFDSTNDSVDTSTNSRIKGADGEVLQRSDRSQTLGVGIPSGIVVLMPPSGDAFLLIGCGGGLCGQDPVPGGTIIPTFWMRW